MRRRELGFSIALLVAVLGLIIGAMVAAFLLTRFSGSRDEMETTRARMEAVMSALDQYAAQNRSLPCPAVPTLASSAANAGVAAPAGSGCANGDGTVPWKTIGLKEEHALDAWGRRISYRVFSTAYGSLTQAGGASMVDCDLWRINPGSGLDPVTGLCAPARTTDAADYIALERLRLYDFSPAVRTDVAYVLVSHGATGYGAYSSSGAPLPAPKGPESDNTKAGGPFHSLAFADLDKFDASSHFDDLVAYRTVSDLVKRAGLSGRDWPEAAPPDSTVFTRETVASRPGVSLSSPSDTDTNRSVIDFGSFAAIGVEGGTLENVSAGASGGIGVVGSGNPLMTYSEGEALLLSFDSLARRFGITLSGLNRFNASGTRFTEKVAFAFYRDDGSALSTVLGAACANDADHASFDIDPGGSFRYVFIVPLPSTAGNASGGIVQSDTGFLVAEIRTCAAATATDPFCRTSLSTAANTCSPPGPDLRVAKTHSGSFAVGSNGTYTLTVNNALGLGPTTAPVTVSDVLPAGLTFVSASGSGWTCSGAGTRADCTSSSVIAAGGSSSPITLTVSVGSGAAASVTNTATVSGGGERAVFGDNNSTSDVTTVTP